MSEAEAVAHLVQQHLEQVRALTHTQSCGHSAGYTKTTTLVKVKLSMELKTNAIAYCILLGSKYKTLL